MIEGMDNLNRRLRTLATTVIDNNMEKAVGNQIKMVQAEAKMMCPSNDGELRNSIKTMTKRTEEYVMGICYTNKEYGPFVEFGTGPKGEADHSGISPSITPSYSQSPWWIHESQIDKETAEKYHFAPRHTKDGTFYLCYGQTAQPFMYPALKNNEKKAAKNIGNYIARKIREAAHG